MNELERSLVLLGRELEVPETPELAPGVLGRTTPPRGRRVSVGRVSLAVAFVLVALLAAALAIPSARSALFDVLHISGAEIVRVDDLPPVEAKSRLPSVLGRPVSLAQARRRAGFRLRELEPRPDHVYLGVNNTVWFLNGTPTQVQLLVAQTPHERVDPLLLEKLVAAGTRVDEVGVNGALGAFLSGRPHEVIVANEQGVPLFDTARLARNVLLWSQGGIAYRLEGDFSPGEALRLARSLRWSSSRVRLRL